SARELVRIEPENRAAGQVDDVPCIENDLAERICSRPECRPCHNCVTHGSGHAVQSDIALEVDDGRLVGGEHEAAGQEQEQPDDAGSLTHTLSLRTSASD